MCKDRLSTLEAQLEQYSKNDPNFKRILERSSSVRRHMDLAKSIQKQASKPAQESSAPAYVSTVTFKELSSYSFEHKASHLEKKQLLFKRMTDVVLLIRSIPVLYDLGHEYIDKLLESESGQPLPYFLKARLNMSYLTFCVGQYLAGEKHPGQVKEIQEAFKQTYHYYGLAVNKIGSVARTATEYTILIEYANLVHYFYKVSINILNFRPPRSWLHTAFSKALKALTLAQDSDRVSSLVNKLRSDMSAEGLD